MGRRGLLGLVRGDIPADFQWCTDRTSFVPEELAVLPGLRLGAFGAVGAVGDLGIG